MVRRMSMKKGDDSSKYNDGGGGWGWGGRWGGGDRTVPSFLSLSTARCTTDEKTIIEELRIAHLLDLNPCTASCVHSTVNAGDEGQRKAEEVVEGVLEER